LAKKDEELRDSRSDSEEDTVSDTEQEEDKEEEDHICLDKEAVKVENSLKEGINGVIANRDNDVAHEVK